MDNWLTNAYQEIRQAVQILCVKWKQNIPTELKHLEKYDMPGTIVPSFRPICHMEK